MSSKNEVRRQSRMLGLTVSTYAPGDGATRYKFYPGGAIPDGARELGTALGAGSALVWLAGYRSAIHYVEVELDKRLFAR